MIRELAIGRDGTRRWQVVLTGSRKADGTYARVTRVVAGTKRAARQAMAEMDIDLAKRPHDRRRVGSGVTVGQLLSRWLAHAETFEGRSPSTLREYRRVVAVELVPVLGSVKLYDLSVRHLETGTVRVDTSAFEEGGVRIEKSTKTRSVREVSLDRGTLGALRAAHAASRAAWDTVQGCGRVRCTCSSYCQAKRDRRLAVGLRWPTVSRLLEHRFEVTVRSPGGLDGSG